MTPEELYLCGWRQFFHTLPGQSLSTPHSFCTDWHPKRKCFLSKKNTEEVKGTGQCSRGAARPHGHCSALPYRLLIGMDLSRIERVIIVISEDTGKGQRQADLWIWGQPGLGTESQDNQEFCLGVAWAAAHWAQCEPTHFTRCDQLTAWRSYVTCRRSINAPKPKP